MAEITILEDENEREVPSVVTSSIWYPPKNTDFEDSDQARIQRHIFKSLPKQQVRSPNRMTNINALLKIIKEQKGTRAYNGAEKLLKSRIVDPNSIDLVGLTPLMYVATYHEDKACIDLIELLVSHGAQLNMLNPSGESILHLLIEQKQFDVAIYLIRKYPTLAINSITKKGENALKICARLGDSSLKAVKALLGTERINVNSSKGLKGRTALHLAAENGSKEIVDLLLKHKADVNCKDLNNQTPLHLAAINFHSEIVKKLLDSHVDTSIIDSKGMTASQLAANKFYGSGIETMSCFLKHCTDQNSKRPPTTQMNSSSAKKPREDVINDSEIEFEINTANGSDIQLVSELQLSDKKHQATPFVMSVFTPPTMIPCASFNTVNGKRQKFVARPLFKKRPNINFTNVFYPKKYC